jgi:uncharacterized protein involved in exopolysaccharide biosynthesis
VYPTWSNVPRLIGDLNTPHGDNSQFFSPTTGFPVHHVPMGYTRGDTLPAGITFFGKAWDEATRGRPRRRSSARVRLRAGHAPPPAAGPSQLAFAIALTLTRRHSFAIEEDSLFAAPNRSSVTVAMFGGWLSVVTFTTLVVAALAYAASFLIQPLYQSRAQVLVIPPRMPAPFVEPAASVSLDERVRALSSTALSHRSLEEVILSFDLYRSDRGPRTSRRADAAEGGDLATQDQSRPGDAAIERMRKDISVEVHADGQSFEVAYVSPNPRMAMLVTGRLTTLFFKANTRDRDIGESARQFLDAQIKDVRSRLLKRTGNPGLSPSNQSDADVLALEHESLKTTYRDLLMRKEQAIIWADLEAAQFGEQFMLISPARLPEAPVSPDRTRLTLLGAIIGFCLGVATMMAGRDRLLRRPRKMLAQS